MTRIIAGAARGRRLAVPPGAGTRPTSDRAREALFSTLESLLGAWAGRRVLDLYAGSGAVGLEALSRGAAHALLVESDARAARTLAANVATLGLRRRRGAARPGRAGRRPGLPGPAYDVVFADPPYDLADDELRDGAGRPAPGGGRRRASWWSSGPPAAAVGPGRPASRPCGRAATARPRFGTVARPSRIVRPAREPAVEEGTA